MTSDDYVRRVGSALRDLPWAQRRALISELREHLGELPTGSDLGSRLGTPEQYASDLRSAAGLERRHGASAFLRARRPRNVVLTVVALLTLGLAIGAVAFVQTYQPIAWADATLEPPGGKEAPGNKSESVVFHEGGRFLFGITITNTGPFSVRVLGLTDLASALSPFVGPSGGFIPANAPALPFSAAVVVSSRPLPQHAVGPPYMRFHPFDLGPGDARVLMLKGRYANCHAFANGPAGYEIVSFPIRYRFLWRTATTRIALENPLSIVFPKGNPCG